MTLYKLLTFFIDYVTPKFGGGDGGSQPTTQTVNQVQIPPELMPYATSTLAAAKNQLFQTDTSGNITGMQPYVPYSTDPSKYIANFSPLQSQAQTEAANLSLPGQFQAGSQLTGAAALGSMGAANQAQGLMGQALGYGQQGDIYGGMAAGMAPQAQRYGQMGAMTGMQGLGYGAQGAQAGQAGMRAGMGYGQQATNPAAVQAYMNPYIQSSLQPQLNEIARQGNIAAQQAASQATASGAFGGTRGALAQNEAQRNALMAQQQAIGQGYNTAYNQAQQAMQQAAGLGMQGAGLGIQGAQAGISGLSPALQGAGIGLQGLGQAGSLYGQGMQGAQAGLQGVSGALGAGQYGLQGLGQAGQMGSNLANIGSQSLAAQQGIIGTQAAQGATQQQQQQNIINQAIQNYATAQQYPMMQLGTMMDLVRGTPTQTVSTQTYQAPPSMVSQLGGLAATGIGAYGALNKKKGGKITEKAGSGLEDLGMYNAMKGN